VQSIVVAISVFGDLDASCLVHFHVFLSACLDRFQFLRHKSGFPILGQPISLGHCSEAAFAAGFEWKFKAAEAEGSWDAGTARGDDRGSERAGSYLRLLLGG